MHYEGDRVRLTGELPDGWARTGEVVEVIDGPDGVTVVRLDDGHYQEVVPDLLTPERGPRRSGGQ